jgi:hypothetical protein
MKNKTDIRHKTHKTPLCIFNPYGQNSNKAVYTVGVLNTHCCLAVLSVLKGKALPSPLTALLSSLDDQNHGPTQPLLYDGMLQNERQKCGQNSSFNVVQTAIFTLTKLEIMSILGGVLPYRTALKPVWCHSTERGTKNAFDNKKLSTTIRCVISQKWGFSTPKMG